MRDHVKKEHQTEFKCKECQFRTKYKIVRRRHMGEFVVEGFFFLEVVTFFVTLRADLEDYFKCKT